jgi:hypothetical protein
VNAIPTSSACRRQVLRCGEEKKPTGKLRY